MHEQRRIAKTARWLMIWVVFTIAMRFVTDLAGIYQGWLNTAVTSASIVAIWFLGSWFRSRRERTARRLPTWTGHPPEEEIRWSHRAGARSIRP
ncbi:hypothetical protein [Streptomyces sp. NPDC058202]|uniref:hypothetical protein n=1 Tax=Streptomyces sp. NPDC058202 TaxID=3346380 RepID=UPI0036E0FEE9